MFCYQCQEAASGVGCTIKGVCGKDDKLSGLMDVLLYVTKGISIINSEIKNCSQENEAADRFILDALFSTITNANFDKVAITDRITKGLQLKNELLRQTEDCGIDFDQYPQVTVQLSPDQYESFAPSVGVLTEENEDIRSLKELILYGVKGLAAYAHHALNLGNEDASINEFISNTLAQISRTDNSVDELVALTLKTGEFGVKGMALLDNANTSHYGNPEITKVNIGVGTNPGILISGHDLKDIEELLAQTEGTGVDVYTHSEMLPAHYYPAFKKYKHFVGNYGNAWWKQRDEFETFNGPVLFTTNCIVPPFSRSTYQDRIYTTGSAGLPGAIHIADREAGKSKDFSVIIEHAKKCTPPTEIEKGEIVGGFAHNQVIALADKVVEAVKTGAIKKFVVMAGCDGRMKSRDYYTDFARQLPEETVILTAGCAKYRYNKLQLGDIGGIPRVLDAGQCNDSYSLAVIALKLKEVFGLEDINDLPIVYNIAWYEQKAVIVLLALLYLGVKNIGLGPTLPAFLSPNVASVLVKNFGIRGISTVENDMENWINN
jgi:hydroxylamine reductase